VDDVHAPIALTLRAATEADGPAIGAIKVDTWRRAYPGILPAPVLDGLDADEESAEWGAYARAIAPEHRLIVAVQGGEVIGYGRSEPCPDADLPGAGEVAGLYVHPAAQGTGAGRAMLVWLVDDLLARNLTPVVLWHFVGNERAAAVYAAAGFEPDGARRPVPGLDVDEVRLRLRPRLR
jgi:GNAT superfamily N-acetyltransferase